MIHFSALDYILWLLDFILAGIGTFVVFSRYKNIWPLWILLAWWTAGDVLTFVLHFSSVHAYIMGYFAVNLPLLALEAVLVATLCGRLVKERQAVVAGYSGILGLALALGVAWRHHAPLYIDSVLKTELACCGAMAVFLIAGWIGNVELLNREVGKPWRAIIAAAILLVAVQAVSFGLQAKFGLRYWDVIARIRPVGELAVLGLFIRAGLQKAPLLFLVCDFVNRSGEKFEPTSIMRERRIQTRMM